MPGFVTMMQKMICIVILCLCSVQLAYTSAKEDDIVFKFEQKPNRFTRQQDETQSSKPTAAKDCSLGMFGGDQIAFQACLAQAALQNNWFPSPISGLFSYQAWNGFDGFWQNGIVLETFANCMQYANHTRYLGALTGSLRSLSELLEAYYPQPSYDDMAWYGLSYLRVYEVLGKKEFLTRAKEIHDWNWQDGWDSSGTCWGGFWFDQGRHSKVSITNVQMLQLSAKLYQATGSKDKDLLNKMKKIWRFIRNTKIINEDTYLVADGILDNCTHNSDYGPDIYSNGVLSVGLIHMSKVLNDSSYLELAHRVANATIVLKSVNGILTEYCDLSPGGCGNDAKVFKGIFARSLRYLMDVSNSTVRQRYQSWLEHNIQSVLKNDSCTGDTKKCNIIFQDGPPFYNVTGPVFDTCWHGPYNTSTPMQQTSVLDLLVSAIQPGTVCSGAGCRYDPPTPPPRPITCKDDPCPPGQQCCSYGEGFRTCCEPGQVCNYGFCE